MMRLLLALAACVLWVTPAEAAITVVQTSSSSGNDATMTFGSPWGASNHVLIAAMVNTNTDSVDLTGIGPTETVLVGHVGDGGSPDLGVYFFCFAGDGADTTVVLTTSGGGAARAAGIEIAGGGCTSDGTPRETDDATTPYELGTDLTTTTDGSIVFGLIHSNSAADYTASGATTGVGTGDATTDIGTVALGGYQITTTAGAYDLTWTSAGNETSLLAAAAVQAAAVGGGATKGLLLLGVGGAQ